MTKLIFCILKVVIAPFWCYWTPFQLFLQPLHAILSFSDLILHGFSARGCKSDSRRVCLCCVNCNHNCNLRTFLWLHPIKLSLNYRWNKYCNQKVFLQHLSIAKILTKIIECWCIRVFQLIGIFSISKIDFQLVIWRNYQNWYRYQTCQENYRKIIIIGKKWLIVDP